MCVPIVGNSFKIREGIYLLISGLGIIRKMPRFNPLPDGLHIFSGLGPRVEAS